MSVNYRTSLRYNKVCEFEDFSDPQLREAIRDVFRHEIRHFTPKFPTGAEYRKYWEIAMSVRTLRDLGALHPDARILGVGAGTEATLFYLTNHVKEVVATDLYNNPGHWSAYAPQRMLTEPERFAPYTFQRDRLTVLHMDGCHLQLEDATFDGIFTSSSVEHFGTFDDVANAAYEMGRVLKPGGILTLSTEYMLTGPAGSYGWEGVRLFRRPELVHYIVEASGLELVDELATHVSRRTLASEWEHARYVQDSERQRLQQRDYPRMGEIIWSHYPHLVLRHDGHTWTSVHLALRKTRDYPLVDNGWARPRKTVRLESGLSAGREDSTAAEPPVVISTQSRAEGVNFIGDVVVDSGLGEAARKTLNAVLSTGIPVSLIDLRYHFWQKIKDLDPSYAKLYQGSIYDANLLYFNFHQLTSAVSPNRLAELTQGKYTIAYWVCELPKIPKGFLPAFSMVDEIWTPSRYSQEILLKEAWCPVRVVPHPVEVPTSPSLDRSRFGIPEERYIFLYTFSSASDGGRKNPWGVIKAFEKAFGRSGRGGPLLVLKAQHGEYYVEYQEALRAALQDVGGILLEEAYTRQQMNDLLACADAYVSLHRAEGFGLGMAEAMYLGKPVIATYYSGNVDYMHASNSYPVRYSLRPLTEADRPLQPHFVHLYPAGQLCAEPDLDEAARWMRHVYENQEEGRQRGERAAEDIRRYWSPAVVGQLMEDRLRQIKRDRRTSKGAGGHMSASQARSTEPVRDAAPSTTTSSVSHRRVTGVNLIGDLRIDSGLGEAMRTTLGALLHHGIPVSYIQLAHGFGRFIEGGSFQGLSHDSIYPVNLMFYNLTEYSRLPMHEAERVRQGKYTVVYWVWEWPEIPLEFRPAFSQVDEIWTASRFCHEALSKAASCPVRVVPHSVSVQASPTVQRASFGIPDDRYVFLCTFSAASFEARKNPSGAIEAFESAFERAGSDGPILVLKGHHLDLFPELRADLRAAVERLDGILLEESYTRQQMNDLLACADAYVSLHRAEGFGLGMAEAMYLGKPVIATYYSGNVDYMHASNSYPVRYSLRPLTQHDLRYHPDLASLLGPNQLWAEPDLDDAARWMRHVYENQEEGRQRGERAAEDIRRHCNPAVIANVMGERLAEIEQDEPPQEVVNARLRARQHAHRMVINDGLDRLWAARNTQHESLLAWEETRSRDFRAPLARLPVVGFLVRTLVRIRWLGHLAGTQSALNHTALQEADVLSELVARSNEQAGQLSAKLEQMQMRVQRLERALLALDPAATSSRSADSPEAELGQGAAGGLGSRAAPLPEHATTPPAVTSELLDQRFDYYAFAERLRGPFNEIKRRHSAYLDLFLGRNSVLDLGCGRGEFVELLSENGVRVTGVDNDTNMVDFCRARGLRVEQADIFAHLTDLPDASIDGIFASQVVEHLPADQLLLLIDLCAQKLKPGGVIVAETVNPYCPFALANFYVDPSHVRPVPPPLLWFMLEEASFKVQALKFFRPSPSSEGVESLGDVFDIASSLRPEVTAFMDYALVATRP